jgi:uncharacterized membrane protein
MTTDVGAVGLERPPVARAAGAVRLHAHVLVVWAAMIVWSAAMFATVRADYLEYRLGRFDLGNMTQAVWSTAHGRPLENTTISGDQISRLAGHVDPILALLAPLWLVFPSPLTLAAVQVVAVSLGALPVYWLARAHLGSASLAVVLAISYLLYPWLAWTTLDAMHPVTLAIPLLLFGIWFLDADRLAPFAVCAVLTAATGELMGLTIAALGLWYAFARGRRGAGLTVGVLGLAWTAVALLVVVPAFSGGESRFYGFYESVGGSPLGILKTAVTDPLAIAGELFDPNVLVFLIALAAPLAGLFVLAPALAAVALPQLVVNALADPAGPIDPRQHYLAAIVPCLFAATVIGISRLRSEARGPAAVAVLGLTLVTSVAFGPLGGGREMAPLWYQQSLTAAHIAALDRAVAAVPTGAPVSASNRVGAHLAARRTLQAFPRVGDARWIVLDVQDRWLPDDELPALEQRPAADMRQLLRSIRRDPAWTAVLAQDGVYVFRRAATQ